MPTLEHFSPDAAADELLAAIRRDGAIIIDQLVDAKAIAALRSQTDPYMEASLDGADDFSGRDTTRTGGLVSRSEGVRELILNPLILSLCDGFLLDSCECYQLHLTQIIRLRPGQGRQMIHRDKWAWGAHLAHLEPQLNTIWALTDFSEENGATVVAPGSVDWPDQRQPEADELTQAVMSPGSVLVYSGSVFHGGGHNRSAGDRIGLNLTYALGWLRQEENQYLSTPPELARELEPRLQELIGYSMGQYALGYYTPPGPPGEEPETVSPAYALGHEQAGFTMGSAENLEKALSRLDQGD